MEKESVVQKRAMNIIRKYGGYVYKNAQSIYTEKGRPDLTACVPTTLARLEEMLGKDARIGVFVGIEMKREGHLNNVSNAQDVVGKQIQKASGIWLAVDDTSLIEALMIKFTGGTDAI